MHEPNTDADPERRLAAAEAALREKGDLEAALRRSEELRRIAVEGARMGTWRWNLRDELIWGDDQFLSLWGYLPSDEPRQLSDFTDRMSSEGQAEMGKMVASAVAAGEEFDGQLAVVSGPTSGRWVRWRGRAEPEQSWIINGVSFDITSQRLSDERLRQRGGQQAFLLSFSDALREEPDADAIANRAITMLSEQLKLDRCYITFYRPDDDEADFPYQIGKDSVPPLPPKVRLSDFPDAYEQVRERTFVLEDEFERQGLSEAEKANSKALGMRAMLASTARRGERYPLSSLVAVSASPRRWTAEEVELVEVAAERTWAAMERARADAALTASEERYRSLFETMDQGYSLNEVVRDAEGRAIDIRYLEHNPALERLTGVPASEAIGRLASEVFPGLDRFWIDVVDRIVTSGVAEQVEHELSPIGRWYQSKLYPVGGDRCASLFDDITERKTAEMTLRESQERQAFLLGLSDAMRSQPTAGAKIEVAARLLGERLDASRVLWAEYDWTRNVADIFNGWFADGAQPFPTVMHLEHYDGEVLNDLRAGRTVRVDDVGSRIEEPAYAAIAAVGVHALLSVPLLVDGTLRVNVSIHQHEVRSWTDREVLLVQDVGERLWAEVERARAESALRESERVLSAMLNVIPVGVGLADRIGRIVRANPEWERFVPSGRVPSRDPERSSRWRAWNEEGNVVAPENYPGAKALRGEHVVRPMEFVYADDGGRESWTSVAAVPLRNDVGEVTGSVSIIQNIDEAKRAERALRESEERLRNFGEASQDILWIRDAETLQWQYLTPAFEAIYGQSREEALAGNNYRGWLDLIVPEDRVHALEHIKRVKAGEQVAFEYRIRRPSDGMIRWLRNTDFPIRDDAGNVTLIGGIGHDFTELREAELRLHALIEGIPQLVWRAGDPGLWTWASPQWTAYTGQEEAGSWGWGWLEPLHPDDRELARKAWSQAAERGELEVEYRIGDRDDVYRWFQTRAAPVRDKGGQIVEWLGTSTDIHDLRELQDRQQVMVKELQHRTRNLITVVRALFKQTMKDVSSLEDFDHQYNDRLSALSRVQGLLSHLSAGKRVTFDELLMSELTALGAPDDKVTLDGPKGVPLKSATVQTFSLALHELATNALKYGALAAPNGHLTVKWTVAQGDPHGPRLKVDWCETGVVMTHVADRPRGGGYGRQLIERALPYQLGAKTSYELANEGVHCTIDVPASMATAELD